MKLMAEIIIAMKKGDLPKAVDEIYGYGFDIHSLKLVERAVNDLHEEEKYSFSIFYPTMDLLSGFLEKIKSTDKYRIISVVNTLEENIKGGLISVCGRRKIETESDFELEVLGASNLIREKVALGLGSVYTSISKSVCLVSAVKIQTDSDRKLILASYAAAEKDAVILNFIFSMNGYPLVIKYNQIEDLIKFIQSIESNFSAIRLMDITERDIQPVGMIQSEIKLPFVSRDLDEIPLYILMIINKLIQSGMDTAEKLAPSETAIGIIGLEMSSLRLTTLLKKSGFSRILGYDANEKLTLSFENLSGLATTTENIFSNSDIVILLTDKFDHSDYKKIRPGQFIISFLNDNDVDMHSVKERGVREFIKGDFNNLANLFPGILKAIVDSGTKNLDDTKIIKLAGILQKELKSDYRFPEIFDGMHGKVYTAVTGNPFAAE
jgi:hypothetical protein